MSPRDASHVERALRKTAQLRALTLSLRRASESAARERLLSEFDSFVKRSVTSPPGVKPVPLPSADVLLTGFGACWARRDYAAIRNVASLLSRHLLDQHLLLRAYVTAVADSADTESRSRPLRVELDQKS